MRLMAKEDDVYKLMDRRDLYLGAAGLCGIVSVVLLLFISYGYGNWENLYFLSVLIVGMIFFAVLYMENQPTDYGSGTVLSGTG